MLEKHQQLDVSVSTLQLINASHIVRHVKSEKELDISDTEKYAILKTIFYGQTDLEVFYLIPCVTI